ncbi:O-methyltransferase [Limnochorda pilosa]|uniref:O-methyltransferase n=1 Tax=Limnochorda pilosa TaxID=1555112 RepID=A0A0K2SIA7_LIMPI|nr:class I SAM-dependent methyltransferase [Limnochorda pilosa]BAS26861.1 O-methyltransferase [Limnochorda pilosa]
MNDHEIEQTPAVLEAILHDTRRIGFTRGSEPQTGTLLRTLAASKPGGRFLKLGTGTGLGTAWLLSGMDATARLDSVDNDPTVVEVARRHLGHDPRVRFHIADGGDSLAQLPPSQFDFMYADTWPGEFTHLDLALSLLRVGGIYFVDDLFPQPSWPEGPAPKVGALISELVKRRDFIATKLAWASGLMILARVNAPNTDMQRMRHTTRRR